MLTKEPDDSIREFPGDSRRSPPKTMFNALSAQIVVLDRHGTIAHVSRSSTPLPVDHEAGLDCATPGVNYLEVCGRAAARHDESAREALDGVLAVLNGRVRRYAVEYPCHSATERRWFFMTVDAMPPEHGGVVISHTDITWRKQVEAALIDRETELRLSHERIRDLAGRLITAQEEERRRIARELHDDISQRLAALAITLSRLRQRLPESTNELREGLEGLHACITDLSNDVRDLSRELHPAMLEHAGVATAIRSLCEEFSARAEVHVEVSLAGHRDDYCGSSPPDTALCLYRVVQEALRNISAHSGAKRARVDLRRVGDSVLLAVTDAGSGFDPATARRKGGLGLISMEERVRRLGGKFFITSEPGAGTALTVRLPV